MTKLPETTATDNQPQDTKVIPFLPVLRRKLGQHLSPPATKLAVTEAGAKSRLWRGLGAIWHRLVTLSLSIGVQS